MDEREGAVRKGGGKLGKGAREVGVPEASEKSSDDWRRGQNVRLAAD